MSGVVHKTLFYRLSFADVLLIAVVLAGPVLALRSAIVRPAQAKTVYVYHDNRLLVTQSLARDTVILLSGFRPRASASRSVPSGLRVEVKAGRVRVAESDCPHQLCVRRGWISRAGQVVVCVPNRVLIEIRGTDAGGIDAETH